MKSQSYFSLRSVLHYLLQEILIVDGYIMTVITVMKPLEYRLMIDLQRLHEV
jgi:hypothetical protein